MGGMHIQPNLLSWARERAGLRVEELQQKIPQLASWEAGQTQPTYKQLVAFAQHVRVPIGYLFLPRPPEEQLPIADFRTPAKKTTQTYSVNLRDTIYLCQLRQDWFRRYAISNGYDKIPFVGSVTRAQAPSDVAARIQSAIGYVHAEGAACRDFDAALRYFVGKVEDAGVLINASGIVGSNSNRKLSTDEFRGFALSDAYAPLIFINAADSKAAQQFTLAHELAHIWLGESGVSHEDTTPDESSNIEDWCNAVAAELLLPLAVVKSIPVAKQNLEAAVTSLVQHYRVSTFVVLRRLLDAQHITKATYWEQYNLALEKVRPIQRTGTGGDFYRTLSTRCGKRFSQALIADTLEGKTLFTEAFRLLGVRSTKTFMEAAKKLEVG